ncbi:MAG: undecaprenyl-phosphate glucose phosphotransferase [Rhizobiales bacterium 65-9]|nr:undecaprenyl-phosphate glucose phosphotransferase [Hyphomicrobiales bacterium]OJY36833.1 MAG: undecaprenyl-phosphate glucose phosphotransferase [Rhizobiales bacterium 65-9]
MTGITVRDLMQAGDATPAEEPRGLSPIAERIIDLPPQTPYSTRVLAGLVQAADFVIVAASGLAIYGFYPTLRDGFEPGYLVASIAVAVFMALAFEAMQIYTPSALRSLRHQGLRIIACWTCVFLAALGALFFLKIGTSYSRVWLGLWFFLGLGLILIERAIVAGIVRRLAHDGRLDRRTVIVGGGAPGEQLIRALESQRDSDLRILGVFDDRADDRSPDIVAAYPKLGGVSDLVEFARRTRVDLIVFSVPVTAEARILAMLRKLWVLPIDIKLSAHASRLRFRPRSYSYIGMVPVLDIIDRPIADWDVVLKWLFDKAVGSLLMIALTPVLLLAAIAVKLDSRGPVFFKQRRYGFNNELVEVYKFRSMYVEASDATASKLVTKGDPRVTRVGRFIRKTSIDELPQLFNVVFKGNLSLVGPRPHAVHAKAADKLYDDVVDGYFARHKVKPGITGWAQINGWRGETDTPDKIQRRVEHDIYYIENWSLFFDLYILAKTPFALMKTENAY